MAVRELFASATLPEHFARGVLGIDAYYYAGKLLALSSTTAFAAAIALGIASLFIMRGCPVCWTVVLFNATRNTVFPFPQKAPKSY
jgi:hypothetical protein